MDPVIILVEPQLGENIGTAARAMANFGVTDLRLVRPRDGWPSEKARNAASRADHVIEKTKIFETLEEALADLDYVLATTARQRDMLKPVRHPVEAAQVMRQTIKEGGKVGVMFGRERWGLENDEIVLANEILTLPVDPNFSSLNIAQAVLIICYEWRMSGNEREAALPFETPDVQRASKEEMVGLFEHLEQALDEASFFRPAERRVHMVRNLRTILQKGDWAEQEVRTLRGVVAALQRGPRDDDK
ncbi:RNA methyltransferase [Cohaesibacter celericrescens]|uniref:tRNA (cytidine/uridine-2'-O-)-methyltransferase TrmJ n=1 Tax=Cohaesibacter celericrescens TaxID=2067669 RepID=A0A2N5XWB3_9HYPH|nr:RNA methyltransferase [Cohaesibacter celericrescens]PLW78802.1 RNA methyltransferase [Cohaesibacter celericrescens]